MAEKSHFEHPNTNRVDALTDGVFAIAATLLVIEIKLPNIPTPHTQQQVLNSLLEVVPSFVAFAISFFTILIYWINHDGISKAIKYYNHRGSWLNIIFAFLHRHHSLPNKIHCRISNRTGVCRDVRNSDDVAWCLSQPLVLVPRFSGKPA